MIHPEQSYMLSALEVAKLIGNNIDIKLPNISPPKKNSFKLHYWRIALALGALTMVPQLLGRDSGDCDSLPPAIVDIVNSDPNALVVVRENTTTSYTVLEILDSGEEDSPVGLYPHHLKFAEAIPGSGKFEWLEANHPAPSLIDRSDVPPILSSDDVFFPERELCGPLEVASAE